MNKSIFWLFWFSLQASASENPACLIRLLDAVSTPGLENHFVYPDSSHQAMAPEFLKQTETIYRGLPASLDRPQRMNLELTTVLGKGSSCHGPESKIVCEVLMTDSVYGRHGVESIRSGLALHAHELGHLISYQNIQNHYPALAHYLIDQEHPFFQKELKHAIELEGKPGYAAAKEAFARKHHFWQAYDEVFADLIGVVNAGDPSIMAKAAKMEGTRINEARDFAVFRNAKTWSSEDLHNDFSPVRSHLWVQYLENKKNPPAKIIAATYRAMMKEIEETLKHPEIYYLSLAEKNDRFIKAIDREFALEMKEP